MDDFWLVVWTPLKNMSQLGWLFPIYGKIKNGNQTTNQIWGYPELVSAWIDIFWVNGIPSGPHPPRSETNGSAPARGISRHRWRSWNQQTGQKRHQNHRDLAVDCMFLKYYHKKNVELVSVFVWFIQLWHWIFEGNTARSFVLCRYMTFSPIEKMGGGCWSSKFL